MFRLTARVLMPDSDKGFVFRPIDLGHMASGETASDFAGGDIGSREEVLERVFHRGQNDFNPTPGFRSVSVGDLIEIKIEGDPNDIGPVFEFYRVDSVGFSTISELWTDRKLAIEEATI